MGVSSFSTPQSCALADVSFRQIDYWCRTGRVRPLRAAKGSGTQRRFSTRDVQIIWLLGVLSRLAVGGTHGLPDMHALYALDRWEGWFVLAPGRISEVLDDPDELALWPIAVVVDLTACPISEHTPLEAVS